MTIPRQRRVDDGALTRHLTFDDDAGWGFLCRCGHHEDTYTQANHRKALEALRDHLRACGSPVKQRSST
jgi:hypothetical protein